MLLGKRSWLKHPFVAILTSAQALCLLATAWAVAGAEALAYINLYTVLLILGLTGGILLAYRYPIHVEYRLKVELSSLPLYLMVVLLPLPLAILAAGCAILLAELTV